MKPVLHILGKRGWQPALPTPHNLELESLAWEFISSFKEGTLKNALEGAFFKLEEIEEINLGNASKLTSGRCLCISHNSWKDYQRLLNKSKSLSSRLKKIAPEISYLWMQDPQKESSFLIDLKTQKSFSVTLTKNPLS
jgi:hypothetical protein